MNQEKQMRRLIGAWILAGLMLITARAAEASVEVINKNSNELAIGGYFRFVGWVRDNDEGAKKNNDSFRVRHARIALKGKMPNNFSYKIQGDFAPNSTKLKDGYIKWDNDDKTFYIMAGQLKVPYSMSITTSSSSIVTIERPRAVKEMGPDRDIGVLMGGTMDTESDFNWMLGAFNGNTDDDFPFLDGSWSKSDDNDPFLVGGRLEYGDADDFLIGVDAASGALGGGSSGEERYTLTLVGGHVSVGWGDDNEDEVNEWGFQGEYLWGELDPNDSSEYDETHEYDGWWALVSMWFNENWRGHVQVDMFDPNNDVDDDEYTDFTLGFSYHWMGWLHPDNEKFVIEYVHHDEAGDDIDDDEIRALWQVKY
jgi:hypothetical protein